MRGRTREVIRTAMNERKNKRGHQDSYAMNERKNKRGHQDSYEREEEQERSSGQL